jgi:hypothetical protein
LNETGKKYLELKSEYREYQLFHSDHLAKDEECCAQEQDGQKQTEEIGKTEGDRYDAHNQGHQSHGQGIGDLGFYVIEVSEIGEQ